MVILTVATLLHIQVYVQKLIRAKSKWGKDKVTELYDTIVTKQTKLFQFMNDVLKKKKKKSRGKVIVSGREVVGEKGLFITKKRYAILIYDPEGQRS